MNRPTDSTRPWKAAKRLCSKCEGPMRRRLAEHKCPHAPGLDFIEYYCPCCDRTDVIGEDIAQYLER